MERDHCYNQACERKHVKAELAQIAAASVIVTVHPAAIERADIKRLAEVAAEAAELDEPVLVTTLRQLVQARHRSCDRAHQIVTHPGRTPSPLRPGF